MASLWPKKLGNVQVGFLRCEGILDGEECKGITALILRCGTEYPSLLLTRRRKSERMSFHRSRCCQFNSQSVISKMLTIHAIPPASKLGPTVMVRVYILRISSMARKSGGSTHNLTLSQPRRISGESYHHYEPSLNETDK